MAAGIVGALLLLACGHAQKRAVAVAPPLVLAQLALDPADLDGRYDVQAERYLDSNGNTATSATSQFIRELQLHEPVAGEAPVASRILISLNDLGGDAATEFMDAAGDSSVGPPNLQDYIQKQIAGSGDVHADLLDDFPSAGDDSVANRLSWQTDTDGQQITWYSYAVYVREGGLLGLVAARAEDAGHGEPDGLRKEAENLVKKQSDKMHGDRTHAPAPGGSVPAVRRLAADPADPRVGSTFPPAPPSLPEPHFAALPERSSGAPAPAGTVNVKAQVATAASMVEPEAHWPARSQNSRISGSFSRWRRA